MIIEVDLFLTPQFLYKTNSSLDKGKPVSIVESVCGLLESRPFTGFECDKSKLALFYFNLFDA